MISNKLENQRYEHQEHVLINFLMAPKHKLFYWNCYHILKHETPNVLYLPDFIFNLLSISKFTKENNCSLTFYAENCLFQDLQNWKLMGIGRTRHELYYLVLYCQGCIASYMPKQLSSPCTFSIPCNSNSVTTSSNSTSTDNTSTIKAFNFDFTLWHQRLGQFFLF